MDGFKLTKDSFMVPSINTFWGVVENNSMEEKTLTKEQLDREMRINIEESLAVDKKIAEWKKNPALTKNVMAIIPKKNMLLSDELDRMEDDGIKLLKEKCQDNTLDSKISDLRQNIQKKKAARKDKAMSISKKYLIQEEKLEKWKTTHHEKLESLRGKKRATHITGLTAKMQDFVNNDMFFGNLDSDKEIMKAFEKNLGVEKDLLRLKQDSDFFGDEIDEKLKADFTTKYNAYQAVKTFLTRLVVKMAQGKKRTIGDYDEITKLLGDNILVKGTSTEKIYNFRTTQFKDHATKNLKKEELKQSLKELDLDAEAQEIRKNPVYVSLVNENKNLKIKSDEIKDKWEKQGEETPVFDKDGTPVMIEKLNPKNYSSENGGEWKPFLDANGNPVMIQKTIANNKEAIRKKLKEQTIKNRFGGYTLKELDKLLNTCKDENKANEYNEILSRGIATEYHISGYSGEAFQTINNALRYGKYGKVKLSGGEGFWDEDVKKMVNDLKEDISQELPDEVCLTRHSDLGGLACMFGMGYNSVHNVEELMDRIGKLPKEGLLVRDKAFLSTTLIKDGVAQGGFRQGQVEFRILAPKGTKGLYIEEMSNYPETEQELVLDAGTIFRVTKIDATTKWESSRATKLNDKKVIVYMEVIPKKKNA